MEDFNNYFQNLILRIKSEYNITFIGLRPKYYNIVISVS